MSCACFSLLRPKAFRFTIQVWGFEHGLGIRERKREEKKDVKREKMNSRTHVVVVAAVAAVEVDGER